MRADCDMYVSKGAYRARSARKLQETRGRMEHQVAGGTREAPPELLRGRQADLLALALMLLLVLISFLNVVMPVVTPELREAYSFSSSQIGLLTSIFMFTFCVAGLPMGLLAARLGGRILVGGIACVVSGSVIFALSSSFGWFLGARFLQGLGAATAIPVVVPLIAQTIASERRDRALGIFGAGMGAGTVIALLVLPSIQEAGGHRAVFLAIAVVALLVGVAVLANRAVRSLPSHGRTNLPLAHQMKALAVLVKSVRMLLLILIGTTASGVSISLIVWTPTFLLDQRGATAAVAAYLSAGLGVAQLLGNPAGAATMARWGKPATFVFSLGLLTIFTAAVPLPTSLVLVFILVVVAMFFFMVGTPALLGSVPDIVPRPEEVAPASGLIGLTNGFGTVLAPWIFGATLDAYGTGEGQKGYLIAYLFLALFSLVGAIAAVAYWSSSRKKAPSQAGIAAEET